MAERLSPLAWFAPVSSDGLRVAEVPFLTQIDVRVDPASRAASAIGLALGAPLPTEPGTYATGDAGDVLWMGPDEWLVIAPPGRDGLEARLAEAAAGVEDAHVAITDVSAQRTTLIVDGPRSRDLLAHGCPIDLHPRVFGPGSCAQTTLARAGVVLAAREGDEFLLLVRSSFAGYLAEWLLDAAAEYL
ncbi:sarcosine oxidase subunit gamma [Microbispora sp. NPDC049125]|uniref:sarcosine oxidase subunit gamma n=1 Tax=Microbispora sp. NPDC049125 TaxID=3154929 RepID=UPI003467C56A